MANLDEITNLISRPSYRSDYLIAKANAACIKCEKPAGPFRDNASRLEYQISALCQECQDKYFLSRPQEKIRTFLNDYLTKENK